MRHVTGRITLCTARKFVRKDTKLVEGDALGALFFGDTKKLIDMSWEGRGCRDEWGFGTVAALVGDVSNFSYCAIRKSESMGWRRKL